MIESFERHPKHKALQWDPYSGKWELRATKPRSTSCCQTAWCKNPPACFYRATGKLYVAAHCPKCFSRRYRANHPVHYAFEAIKDSAKKRDIDFSLTIEQFAQWCEETGYADTKGVARLKFHCDRIDHRKGYSIDNIQLLSEAENIRKRNTDIANEDPF